jgi:predicted PurR-regulated permease PerM
MESQRIQTYFFFILFIAVLVLTGFIFLPFVAPVALAAMLAVILRPVHNFFIRIFNKKFIAALLTMLVVFVVVVAPLFFLGTQIFNESYKLYYDVRERGLGDFEQIATKFITPVQKIYPDFNPQIKTYVEEATGWIVDRTGSFFSGTASLIFSFFLGAITLFYLLKDGSVVRKTLIELSPLADKYDVDIFHRLEQAINSVVKGSLLIALVQGLLTGIGLFVFCIPHAILWGSLAAVAALIPWLGTSLILIPAILFLFVNGSTGAAIGLIVWGVIAVSTVDNILLPIFVGKGFRAHPLLILFAVLGGIAFFGPVGIFLGPLVVALLLALIDVYKLLIVDSTRKIV